MDGGKITSSVISQNKALYGNRREAHYRELWSLPASPAAQLMRSTRPEIQIVFQDPYGSLSTRKSVASIIGEGLKIHNIGSSWAERDDMIKAILVEVGLDPEMRHR